MQTQDQHGYARAFEYPKIPDEDGEDPKMAEDANFCSSLATKTANYYNCRHAFPLKLVKHTNVIAKTFINNATIVPCS